MLVFWPFSYSKAVTHFCDKNEIDSTVGGVDDDERRSEQADSFTRSNEYVEEATISPNTLPWWPFQFWFLYICS